MNNTYEGKVMWSHLDANQHMRHSAYADFAAQSRIAVLEEIGLDYITFQKLRLGPILFREELIYLREVNLNDTLKITTELTKSKQDGSRWSMRHDIYRADGVKAAMVNVDGAWIDIVKRKLTPLPEELIKLFSRLPKSQDHEEING
jgi:acyl-CoA thioester hydrolase